MRVDTNPGCRLFAVTEDPFSSRFESSRVNKIFASFDFL